MKIFRRIALFLLVVGFAGALAVAGFIVTLLPDLPEAEEIRDVQLQVPLRVYADNGELIAEFGEQRREALSIEEVPETLVQAILAAEDDAFYSHPGIDFAGIVRAAIQNFRSGQTRQGASTITMQVARNYFLSREKTYTRKIKEALLAIRLERMLTKDQILELYINKIFLGHRSYGYAAAARTYYGRPLAELTLPEMAMLAGLPKAPSRDNPFTNPERAMERRNYVLTRLHELAHIDAAAHSAALRAPLTAERHRITTDVEAPYIAEMARDYMIERFGETAYTAGYEVHTTVVPALQRSANASLRAGLLDYSHRHGYRGPVAATDLNQDSPREDLNAVLEAHPASGDLEPAVILAVREKSATAYTRGKNIVELPWEGLSWARPFKSTASRGPAPETADDVVSAGDVVYVRRVEAEEEQQAGEDAGGEPVDAYWRLTQLPQVAGGLVSLDPQSGAIQALVGGFDFYLGKFNHITQAERQPGSNIKPFIFSAALDHEFTPASQVSGGPIVIDDQERGALWRPQNYSGKFFGPTPLRTALVKSMNLVSVRVTRAIGVDTARDHVARFGFDPASLPSGLSLALGSGTVPPMTVARAYAVLANGGFRVEPYFIEWVEDADGNIVEQASPALACSYCAAPSFEAGGEHPLQAPRVISPANRFLVTSMMRDVIRRGTGRRAMALERGDLAGKTGTTNDFRDAWFSGFNDEVVATVWVGFDDSRTLGQGEAGSSTALPVWVDYMEEALDGVPESPLPRPDNVTAVRIDPATGAPVAQGDPAGIEEYFKVGTAPGGAGYAQRDPSSTAPLVEPRESTGGSRTEGLF